MSICLFHSNPDGRSLRLRMTKLPKLWRAVRAGLIVVAFLTAAFRETLERRTTPRNSPRFSLPRSGGN